jgi:hypothetical protein
MNCSDQRFAGSYWADKNVVVIGASKEIVICQMNPFKELKKIEKPKPCKQS